uniref:MICOS complex subunit MIC13 n=1 Tax=Steinernema glaseri TaxID=37863 RepID=A0A1I7YPX5_9BILA
MCLRHRRVCSSSPTWKEIQLPSSFGFACSCVLVASVPCADLSICLLNPSFDSIRICNRQIWVSKCEQVARVLSVGSVSDIDLSARLVCVRHVSPSIEDMGGATPLRFPDRFACHRPSNSCVGQATDSNPVFVSEMSFFSKVIVFALGGYAGAYSAQNYDIPKLPSLEELYRAAEDYLRKYKKED